MKDTIFSCEADADAYFARPKVAPAEGTLAAQHDDDCSDIITPAEHARLCKCYRLTDDNGGKQTTEGREV